MCIPTNTDIQMVRVRDPATHDKYTKPFKLVFFYEKVKCVYSKLSLVYCHRYKILRTPHALTQEVINLYGCPQRNYYAG